MEGDKKKDGGGEIEGEIEGERERERLRNRQIKIEEERVREVEGDRKRERGDREMQGEWCIWTVKISSPKPL